MEKPLFQNINVEIRQEKRLQHNKGKMFGLQDLLNKKQRKILLFFDGNAAGGGIYRKGKP
jgi:hypothetical protein